MFITFIGASSNNQLKKLSTKNKPYSVEIPFLS